MRTFVTRAPRTQLGPAMWIKLCGLMLIASAIVMGCSEQSSVDSLETEGSGPDFSQVSEFPIHLADLSVVLPADEEVAAVANVTLDLPFLSDTDGMCFITLDLDRGKLTPTALKVYPGRLPANANGMERAYSYEIYDGEDHLLYIGTFQDPRKIISDVPATGNEQSSDVETPVEPNSAVGHWVPELGPQVITSALVKFCVRTPYFPDASRIIFRDGGEGISGVLLADLQLIASPR